MGGLIVQGLGFGDEGKGAVVDFLCRQYQVDLVVRHCGGCQAGHNVETTTGRHTFSQFGAGTLSGVPTYLGPQMIVDLPALVREAEHLDRWFGIKDPYRYLTVDPACLVSTAWHQQWNQLQELARGAARHGSCGRGIGTTRSYWQQYGTEAIQVRDLGSRATLVAKLELLRQRFLNSVGDLPGPLPTGLRWLRRLRTDVLANELHEASFKLTIGAPAVVGKQAAIIFEGAQGLLLDEWLGWHPHVTWGQVDLHHAQELARDWGLPPLAVLGVTRTCTTRHGAGPLPTEDPALVLDDEGNPANPWQGGLRAGWLDLVLLRYALRALRTQGGYERLGLAVTWTDWAKQLGDRYRYCSHYNRGLLDTLPLPQQLRQSADLLAGLRGEPRAGSWQEAIEAILPLVYDLDVVGAGPTAAHYRLTAQEALAAYLPARARR